MRVSELFHSLQGEGQSAGTPARPIVRITEAGRKASSGPNGEKLFHVEVDLNYMFDMPLDLGAAVLLGAIVSIFAHLAAGALDVIDEDGLLVVKKRPDRPIHQYSDMSRPTAWAQWRRDIHGD